MASLPSFVVLCGIGFNVTAHEGLIVFEEAICISGCHERMMFERDNEPGGCWRFSFSTSHERIMASHIVSAFDLVCSVFGKNFEEKQPVP